METTCSSPVISNEVNDENRPTYYKVIHKLDKEKLEKLRGIFKEKFTESTYTDYGLDKQEFLTSINEVYGADFLADEEITLLFKSINKHDANKVKWDEFLDFMTDVLKPEYTTFLQLGKVEYASPPHVKRDTIVKIVLIETEKHFCYAVVSKYGRVGLYDGHFDFLTSYSVIMAREDIQRNDEERRRRNRWITDAIFLTDVLMLLIVNTSRNMVIYDASGLNHIPIWLILGFPDIIQSVVYKISGKNKRRFCVGTDDGRIFILSFKKSKDVLFRKKHSDKLTIYYYRELIHEKEYVLIKHFSRSHAEAVNAVEYFPNSETIISSSRDSNRSIIIKPADPQEDPIIFKMRRGSNCFRLSYPLQLLITGSDDGTIRVWNILVPSKAISVLNTHKCGVVDIIIIEHLNVFISCSRDGELILWNLKEYFCLQTVKLKFPPLEISGKEIEWGTKSIFPGPKRYQDETEILEKTVWDRQFIIVICCNYYAKINLNFLDGKPRQLDEAVLPPPPLQNSFLIPKDWNIGGADSTKSLEVADFNEENKIHIERLSFIIDKNILDDIGGNTDINHKIAKLENKKLQMQWAVEKCAPYLALDLHEIKEIKLPPSLPIPNIKKVKSLVEKTHKMLTDASTRSIIFSEQSSSSKSPRSSRSSIIEFEN